MFEQTFRNIDDVLRKEAGCSSELDYTEQTSWILFLKYLDDLEHERSMHAELQGKPYNFIIDEEHRWSVWAAPKTATGEFDHNNALTGDDLIDYVSRKLFPYLRGFKQRATGPDTIEYKIGEIFGEIKNKFNSGYSLRDALEYIDALRFRSQKEKHELSHIYEAKIKNMGNAGRNGGEYYTPRPLIRAMVQVTRPVIGERIYDGAVGSAGFLCEAYDYLRQGELTTSQLNTLQTSTFYGKEKKSLAYVIAIMNMILHGIDTPNIVHTNTLAENISDIQEKDRFDVILANPPFGGKERKEVQQNFPIKTGETAFLFLQHFIKYLKAGGRGAVVIKNTFLSNSDNASKALRQELLESCNLHTILDCPGGTFIGAGVKTVVLFFKKGAPTRKVWYYQLDPGRSMGKTNPLNDNDLKEFIELQTGFVNSDKSWTVGIADIDPTSFDLSVKNPNKAEAEPLRDPEVIINEIETLDAESEEILEGIRGDVMKASWESKLLVDVTDLITCGVAKRPDYVDDGVPFLSAKNVKKGKVIWSDHMYVSQDTHDELTKNNKPQIGDILYTRVGSFGEAAIVNRDAEFSIFVSLTLIKPKAVILNSFLKYYLNSNYVKQLAKNSISGIGVGNLNVGTVRKFPVPLPPLPEQKHIVAILDEAFAGIDTAIANTEKNLANARELFDGYLLLLLNQPGEGWQETTLGSILNIAKSGESIKSSQYSSSGIPVLTKGDVKPFGKVIHGGKYVSADSIKKNKWKLTEKGDLIVTTRDLKPTGPFLGLMGKIPNSHTYILNQGATAFSIDVNKVNPDYLIHWSRSSFYRDHIIKYKTGSTQVHIRKDDLYKTPIYYPDLNDQVIITEKLNDILQKTSLLESIYIKKIKYLDELKQSLLQKAFSGELTAEDNELMDEAVA